MVMGRQLSDGAAAPRRTAPRPAAPADALNPRTPASMPRRAAPRPAPAPAPVARSAPPAYNATPIGGGGGGGGGGGYTPAAMPAAPPPPSEQDYLAGDRVFKEQQASLERALSDYMAQDTADISRYGQDYGKAVDGLGYRAPVVDNPATTVDESLGGGWNYQDQNTSSGRAYQNQVNDFAGRGMLQSTMYSTALDNLNRSLNEQYTGLNTAKANFTNDKSRARTAYQNENISAGQGAKADSMARYAAIYGAL